jgi:hypothetical protein
MWQFLSTANGQTIAQDEAPGLQRTISFLREKFWITGQFIHTDEAGPDWAIQRKVGLGNLMDKSPACLGIVKSLYYVTAQTSHLVSREYVLDEEGQPRRDFFVLAHTNATHSANTYFLTAEMIADDFELVEGDKFNLPGPAVLDDNYLVSSKEQVLAKMEYALVEADFVKNRLFFSWRIPYWTTALPDDGFVKDKVIKQMARGWTSSKLVELKKTFGKRGGMGQWFTRKLLKERFWIPELSFPLHDAIYDFVIERKITPQNLLNEEPPILGIVKCWFFNSADDGYSIPRTSVIDEDNEPRKDFFFILHTEIHRVRKIHFLPARIIAENFETTVLDGVELFMLPASAFLTGDRYLVSSVDHMLAKMEYQLAETDFVKNRLFFAGTLTSNN